MEENRVAAEGISAVAESALLMNLVQLNLRSNYFGPDDGNALAKSTNLAKLEALNLGNNDMGAEAGGAVLRIQMPLLKPNLNGSKLSFER